MADAGAESGRRRRPRRRAAAQAATTGAIAQEQQANAAAPADSEASWAETRLRKPAGTFSHGRSRGLRREAEDVAEGPVAEAAAAVEPEYFISSAASPSTGSLAGAEASVEIGDAAEDIAALQEAFGRSPAECISPECTPTLHELQAQVDQEFLRIASVRRDWEVARENSLLRIELRSLERELEDECVDVEWSHEVDFWRQEVSELKDRLKEESRRESKAAEVARAWAAKTEDLARSLSAELRSEDLLLAKAENFCAEAVRENTLCEALIQQEEQSHADLKRQLLLGSGAPPAQLFVNALPRLDDASAEWVRNALDAELRQRSATAVNGVTPP
mmetsp:Transcript_59874/g.106791  ORF Transcript_59874/g.106791 Transcript_59874/m.106791 type:complete len:333 (-) Transcript_59874:22-1020(-)